MTIGQRIARKRKELGLSQEALGEELGVSRQSIYKWESDAALPEIEKLIALSKRFGVTVGWLLGVEESPAEGEEPPVGEAGELSETQLKMVEEIVGRYTAALPKPGPVWKRKSFRWGLVGCALLLLGVYRVSSKLNQLDTRYNNLQNQVHGMESSVNFSISSMYGRIEEILKSQNSLAADYGTEILSASLPDNTVTFSVYAVPKTFAEGMTAEFRADSGDGKEAVVPAKAEGERFSADIQCALTDYISLSVVFIGPDGTRSTQLLDERYDLYSSTLPYVELMSYGFFVGDAVEDGVYTTPEDQYFSVSQNSSSVMAVNEALGAAEIGEIRVGLFRDKKLVAWAEPWERDPNMFRGDYPADSRWFYFPPTTLRDLSGDVELCFAAVVTDEYGRDIVYQDIPYVLEVEDGGLTTLTWPSGSSNDPDPSHWEY